jgi:hypothetical protein
VAYSRSILALVLASLALALFIPRLALRFPFLNSVTSANRTMSTSSTAILPRSQAEWRAALDALPSTPGRIPSFYFAHGSPALAFPPNSPRPGMEAIMEAMGPHSPLANFLRDFGPALLEKYKPKGIAVFSAHWETNGERLGELCHLSVLIAGTILMTIV